MESPPSLETVCQAIHTLYHNPDTTGKEKASLWLGELQKSVFAWKIADELLHQKLDLESCYFAAQTMRTKIQCAFYELPTEAHISLRDSLLDHVSHVSSETAPVIVTQLCLALADLALHMATWKTPVSDLVTRFGSNVQHLPPLLEILTVLPEEVSSRSLRLGANRRKEVTDSFAQYSPQVLQLLSACLQSLGQQEPRILVKVFRCLGSWLTVGALPSTDPMLHSLLRCVFQSLVDPATPSTVHEAASDCICSALLMVEDVQKHLTMVQELLRGVYSLVDGYHLSVAREDVDKSANYCRVFTELAESLMDEMVHRPGSALGDLRTLDLLLTCVGNHDYEVAQITFNVWYRLSEVLYKENNDCLNEVFRPYIQRLIVALGRHCQMEPDQEGVLDEGDDFVDFRGRVSELIKDVVFLVGSAVCFRQMFENLKSSDCTWDSTEASLFIMASVAKNIIPEETEIVPLVVEAILNLPPSTHVAVKHTSTQLLGELCEWIEKHQQYLDPILNFLLNCLQQPALASVAAESLQSICAACRKHMGNHFGGLLQIIQAMDTFSLSSEAAIRLVKGAALILSQMLPNEITEGIREMCRTQVTNLSEVMKNVGTPPKDGKGDPAYWLDRIAAIFRHVTPTVTKGQPHPCQPVAEEIWPVLSKACARYQDDDRIIERCCRCLRFMVRCVGRHSASLLSPMVTQMVQIYQVHQHSCFLYLGSILVDEYGSEPGCVAGLLDMLQAFCGPTFRLLEGTGGMRNNPDTVDDLFRLCTRFLQRAAIAFLQSPVMKSVLFCGLAACTLDHKDANTSVMKFFNDLVKASRVHDESSDYNVRQSLIRGLLIEHGQVLVATLLQACLFCLPSYMLPDVGDVMFEILQFDKQQLSQWLETAIKALPTQSSGGTITATQEQLSEFHKNVVSAEQVKSVSSALRDLSRLYK